MLKTNKLQSIAMPQDTKYKYDLEDRTAGFGEDIINFCKTLKQDAISRPLINQLVRSATSVGANYLEANGASSKRDFRNKIFVCKKEAQETRHWLRMLLNYFPDQKPAIHSLSDEIQQLTLIFQKITSTLDGKNEN